MSLYYYWTGWIISTFNYYKFIFIRSLGAKWILAVTEWEWINNMTILLIPYRPNYKHSHIPDLHLNPMNVFIHCMSIQVGPSL